MQKGLDLAAGRHKARRRHRAARWLAALAAALAAAGAWWVAPRLGAALPALAARVDTALAEYAAPGYQARLAELSGQLAVLRTELAQATRLAGENEALRRLAGCAAVPVGYSWQPSPVTGRLPGRITLDCPGARVGSAVIDPQGRCLGTVCEVDGRSATVQAGSQAGMARGAVGLVELTAGGGRLAGLPLHTGVQAGDVVTTLDGLWLGRLATGPTPDAAGLTEQAEMAEMASWDETVYFVAA